MKAVVIAVIFASGWAHQPAGRGAGTLLRLLVLPLSWYPHRIRSHGASRSSGVRLVSRGEISLWLPHRGLSALSPMWRLCGSGLRNTDRMPVRDQHAVPGGPGGVRARSAASGLRWRSRRGAADAACGELDADDLTRIIQHKGCYVTAQDWVA
jgi:hypothetical protein